MLFQSNWNGEAEAAFLGVYENPGEVWAHRGEVEAGREILLNCGPHGWIIVRQETPERVVITGAAGGPGADSFAAVMDALEAFFPVVCVETYREGLTKMLRQRGYQIDHVRLYKK